jgi:hypothetical protein
MLHLTQPHHLRRQDVQRRGLTLQALADILHHQHVFPLVFVVFHQPVGQLLRLRVFLMVRDGPRQRFGAQQRAAPAPQPFRRGAEKCLPGIERHQEMKTVKIAARLAAMMLTASSGAANCRSVARASTTLSISPALSP